MSILSRIIHPLMALLISLPLSAAEKPNILVIWGDDIGWSNFSVYHRGLMGGRTPNIDRIAHEGARPSLMRWMIA